MKKLLLLFALCSSMTTWAQEIVKAETADEVGATVRRLEVVLSGNWLDGANVVEKTTMLIDLVMGYEDGAYNADKAFTEVTVKSAEGSTVTVNQSLIQQLVTGKATDNGEFGISYATANNKIKRLDLSDIAVTHYVGHAGSSSDDPNATFFAANGGTCPIEYLAMPSFDKTVEGQTYSIPPFTITWMTNLKELDLPKNAITVEHEAFRGVNLPYFHLNPGLEFIGNSAFWIEQLMPQHNATNDVDGMEALDVPSSVKYIGPGAFHFHNFTDLYFHSAQAPICPVGKTYGNSVEGFIIDGCYMGNGGNGSHGDDYMSGYANRENYWTNDGYWFAMVHFPASADVPGLDIASYKDDTRVYNKVYGSLDSNPDWTGWDQNKIELALLGHEQEYIEREKSWAFAQPNDWVGKETTVLSYGTLTTSLAPAGKDQVPEDARGKGAVSSGYEDTYRGLSYIWPSQMQYERAFVTVANGVKWDGVTKYRPTLSDEQIAFMIKDGLVLSQNGTDITVGANVVYDEAMANAYNEGLDDAVHAGEAKDWWTAEDALAWNSDPEKNPGRVLEGQSKGEYTAEEAIAYNESLPTAIHAGDAKEKWTPEDAAANNEQLNDAWHENDPIYPTAQEVLDHNADFDGAKHEGNVKEEGHDAVYMTFEQFKEKGGFSYGWPFDEAGYAGIIAKLKTGEQQWSWNMNIDPVLSPAVETTYYSAEQAAAYNAANHPNPWTESSIIGYVTAEQAIAHNETLDGAVKPGAAKSTYSAEEALAWNSDPEKNPGRVVVAQSKGEYTPEEAIAYNESLPTAKHENDEKEWWSAEDAIAENKKLEGAREAGYTESNLLNPEIKDIVSMQAFQSTRRCVFADNAGGGDNYNVNIPSSKEWWTICLPFDLTKAQIDKFFGEGTHVCKFNQVDRKIVTKEEGAAGQRSYVKFYFTDDQYVGKNADDVVLEAHEAYMIFPTVDEEDAVYIANGIPMTEYYKKTGNPNPTIVIANDYEEYEGSDHQEYRFVGNYDTKLPVVNTETGNVEIKDVVVPQYSYIYAKKSGATGKHPYQFWFTQNAGIKWGPNKCIIQSTGADRGLADNSTFFKEKEKGGSDEAGEVKQITVFAYDEEGFAEEETAIEDVIYVFGNGEDQQIIYSVNGVKLDAAPSKGVYIKNGKKYFAR